MQPFHNGSPPTARPAAWAWLGWGLGLGAGVALLIALPARWFAPWLAASTQQQLALSHVQGSVWHGRAQLALASPRHGWQPLPGQWHWDWRLAWINGPAVELELGSDCCIEAPWRVTWQPFHQGTWAIDGLQAHADAAWLQVLGAPWNTLGLQARIRLEAQGMAGQLGWGGFHIDQGQVGIDVLDLSSSLSPIQPLGRYHVAIAFKPALQLTIQTRKGPLLLSGQGGWSGQRLRFSGLARADAPHGEALQPLLSVLGQRQGTQAELNF